MILTPIVTATGAATWTAIVIPKTHECYNVEYDLPMTFWTEDDSGFKYSVNSDGSNPATIPVGKILSIDAVKPGNAKTLLYVQALAGTPNLVCQMGLNRARY